jgi:ATP-binding cassette subfamily D (ALD) protein 3
LKKTAADPSQITRDYVRNSSLLINLAKAIGRLTISYKEIQELAGYTSLVADINEVFQNLRKGIILAVYFFIKNYCIKKVSTNVES